MQTIELIRAVRDRAGLSAQDLRLFIAQIAAGKVPEYQVSAFLMAVCIRGLDSSLILPLTESIRDSGRVLSWDADIQPRVVDKHSTGGVGDKVSLVLAPLAAACGLKVPMVSGRGLGHTGGTLDKLSSISGMRTDLSIEELQSQVQSELGVAMGSQSKEMAPVDRELYALRDATATVESTVLVASSIMAKKLAEGLSGLLIDLKVGNGAFMKTEAEALELKDAIGSISAHAGLRTTILLTRMDEPLGEWIGNRAEVAEALDLLQPGRGSGASESEARRANLRHIIIESTAEMVALGLGKSASEARELVQAKLESGEARNRFWALVQAQGGSTQFKGHTKYAGMTVTHNGPAGYVSAVDTAGLGRICMQLGGGRATAEDTIDVDVAIQVCHKIGDFVPTGATLARVFSADSSSSLERVRAAFTISRESVDPRSVILGRFTY